MGPNAENIKNSGMRVIRGKIPSAVRKELMDAVKNKELGRFKKEGLLPEVFYNTDMMHTAKDIRKEIAEYSAKRIRDVFA